MHEFDYDEIYENDDEIGLDPVDDSIIKESFGNLYSRLTDEEKKEIASIDDHIKMPVDVIKKITNKHEKTIQTYLRNANYFRKSGVCEIPAEKVNDFLTKLKESTPGSLDIVSKDSFGRSIHEPYIGESPKPDKILKRYEEKHYIFPDSLLDDAVVKLDKGFGLQVSTDLVSRELDVPVDVVRTLASERGFLQKKLIKGTISEIKMLYVDLIHPVKKEVEEQVRYVDTFGEYIDSKLHRHVPDGALELQIRYGNDRPYILFGAKYDFAKSLNMIGNTTKNILRKMGAEYESPLVLTAESMKSVVLYRTKIDRNLIYNNLEGIVQKKSGIGNLFADEPALFIGNEMHVMLTNLLPISQTLGVSEMTVSNKIDSHPHVTRMHNLRLIPERTAIELEYRLL